MQLTSVHPIFAAEAKGVDLRRSLADAEITAIVAAIDRFGVLVFRGQHLTDQQQVDFSERLGPVAFTRQMDRPGHRLRIDPKVGDISNLDADGEVMMGENRRRLDALANRLWHTDHSFRRTPATYSLLSAHAVPSSGGETEFADMRAAYDALPASKQAALAPLVAVHSIETSRAAIGFTDFTAEERAALPAARQPLVRTHPGSGRKSLYLAAHAGAIEGIPTPEGRMLLLDLTEHATQPQFVYRHTWNAGDLVIWDNRCTMHRGRDFDPTERRDMRRTTVSEVEPLLPQTEIS